MTVHFENAPLVELVIQMHWDTEARSALVAAEQGVPLDPSRLGSEEAFYDRFRKAAEDLGHRSSERLIPRGYASPVGNATFRVTSPERPHILSQVGPGVLTVNALPPYRAWSDLRSEASNFVDAALQSRNLADGLKPVSAIQMRYLNVFTPWFSGDLEAHEFMSRVLGFKLELPESIEQAKTGMLQVVHSIAFAHGEDLLVELTVGPGQSNSGSGILVDVRATHQGEVLPDANEITTVLDREHAVLHEIFVGMTKSLHEVMGVKEVS